VTRRPLMLGSDNTTALVPLSASDIRPDRHKPAPRFEIYKARDGWRWRLRGANGEIIARGEAYSRKSNARRGIRAMKIAAATAIGPVVVDG
jgi:uncharacterized protein YegP (UPF0339 family)